MFLLDTNVISECRKQNDANVGVSRFMAQAKRDAAPIYISVITLGELRRGIDKIRYRGDRPQAALLESWLADVNSQYQQTVLTFDSACADTWGRLRVPHAQNSIDKQIAATALVHDLTLVTRNTKDFIDTGVKLINPFI